MKTILAPFVRKVLAIHPDDHVSNQEILVTLFIITLMLFLLGVIGRSILILGF